MCEQNSTTRRSELAGIGNANPEGQDTEKMSRTRAFKRRDGSLQKRIVISIDENTRFLEQRVHTGAPKVHVLKKGRQWRNKRAYISAENPENKTPRKRREGDGGRKDRRWDSAEKGQGLNLSQCAIVGAS